MKTYDIDRERVKLFEENRRLGGYTLKVMDEWGSKVKKRFVTEKEKDRYLQDFGYVMISDDDFFDWWCKINEYGKYSHENSGEDGDH